MVEWLRRRIFAPSAENFWHRLPTNGCEATAGLSIIHFYAISRSSRISEFAVDYSELALKFRDYF